MSTCGRSSLTISYLLVVLNLTAASHAAEYDLVIHGARVVDGTGNPAYHADVGITNGRIAFLGTIPERGQEDVDGRGFSLAPGFIDVHTHAEDVLDLPAAENFLRMGVTTLVLGNCGSSAGSVAELFQRVRASNVAVNVATLIGHGTVRGKVMGGSFMRPPTVDELHQMESMVAQAMDEGALGLSTGLIYLPGTFAKTEELIALAKIAAQHEGIYASHMRDEGAEIADALNELFQIARAARIRSHVSHLKLSGKANWHRPHAVLALIEAARGEGLDITQDQYVYAASSTGISQLVPEWAREGDSFADRISDPVQKQKIADEMKRRLLEKGWTNFAYAAIASYRSDPSLNGLNLVDAAGKKFGSPTIDHQIELIFDIQKNGGASAVFYGIDESDLRTFLRHPNTMIASDSGVRRWNEGVPHPRGYGNNARVLGRYVRELKLLRLEDAIRRMTSLPATTFRLRDRGLIRPGNWADLALFDPAQVIDHATFEEPHQYATGFKLVVVNGVVAARDDHITEARGGRPVRRNEE